MLLKMGRRMIVRLAVLLGVLMAAASDGFRRESEARVVLHLRLVVVVYSMNVRLLLMLLLLLLLLLLFVVVVRCVRQQRRRMLLMLLQVHAFKLVL
jgi:hypothetical protein